MPREFTARHSVPTKPQNTKNLYKTLLFEDLIDHAQWRHQENSTVLRPRLALLLRIGAQQGINLNNGYIDFFSLGRRSADPIVSAEVPSRAHSILYIKRLFP
jgi:hypothetical protein